MGLRPLLVCLACLFVLRPCQADSPPDPLRFLPANADVLVKIENPAAIVQSILTDPIVEQFLQLEAVRETYDSTPARRFYQLLDYLERELGLDRQHLLESLTSGGAALAVKIGDDPHVVFVVQGSDETLWRRTFDLALHVAEQEMARNELKEKPTHTPYRHVDTVNVGKDFHAAVAGSALVFSNKEAGLHQALDCLLDSKNQNLSTKSEVKKAHELAGLSANAWMWFNLPLARNAPGGKEIFKLPRNDTNLTVLFGGWLDVAQFAPFLCAGGYRSPEESHLTFHMPRDLTKSAKAMRLNIPPPGAAGARPLLTPSATLLSGSFYFDLASVWEERAQLFNPAQVKALEEFDKNSARFLLGSSFSKLVGLTAPYHRFVVVHQPTYAYKTTPQQNIPSFAYVVELRDPESFGKRMDLILRAAAVLASTQVKLQLFEEEHGGRKIVGYRFSETAPMAIDTTNVRFNFVPCYTRVGKQFVFSSSVGLCRELADILAREEKSPPVTKPGPASVIQLFSSGGAQVLEYYREVLLTQNILDRANSPDKAARQVDDLIQFVKRLGVLRIESRYLDNEFQYELRFEPAKR